MHRFLISFVVAPLRAPGRRRQVSEGGPERRRGPARHDHDEPDLKQDGTKVTGLFHDTGDLPVEEFVESELASRGRTRKTPSRSPSRRLNVTPEGYLSSAMGI
jgi:hypothetical protein